MSFFHMPPAPLHSTTYAATLRDALSQNRSFAWTLLGESMRPTLPPGCVITIRPLQTPRLGDIVVFLRGDRLLAHRLVHRRGGAWVCQGDARRTSDGPIARERIIGRVVEARLGERVIWTGPEPLPTRYRWVLRYHLLRASRLFGRICNWSLAKLISVDFHAIFRHELNEFGEFFLFFFVKFAFIRVKIKKHQCPVRKYPISSTQYPVSTLSQPICQAPKRPCDPRREIHPWKPPSH